MHLKALPALKGLTSKKKLQLKDFFQFEIIINVLVTVALPDSFEYLFYASMAIRNIFTLTVRESTSVVRI